MVLSLAFAPVLVLAGGGSASAATLSFTDPTGDGYMGTGPTGGAGDITAVRVDHTSDQLAVAVSMNSSEIDSVRAALDTEEASEDYETDFIASAQSPSFDPILYDGDGNTLSCALTTTTSTSPGFTIRFVIPRSCLGNPHAVSMQTRTFYGSPGFAFDDAPDVGFSEFLIRDASGVTPPQVSGTPRVGTSLTAVPGTWEPAEAVVTGIQWLVNGLPVPGATGPTYTPGPAEIGKTVQVRYTAAVPTGVPATATSAATTPVGLGILDQNAAGKIRGKLRVGETLKARPGRWTPSDVTVRYRWFAKKPGANRFVKISDARKAKLRLGPALADARIRVRLVIRHPGYEPVKVIVRRPGKVAS
jgi:hypothetical protein